MTKLNEIEKEAQEKECHVSIEAATRAKQVLEEAQKRAHEADAKVKYNTSQIVNRRQQRHKAMSHAHFSKRVQRRSHVLALEEK